MNKEIAEMYKATGSLRETAREFSINWQTIRKILITEGVYANDKSRLIAKLSAKGKSVDDIYYLREEK